MHTRLQLKAACAVLFASLLLTACGGGGGGYDGGEDPAPPAVPPVSPEVVPGEATASPEAFTAWARSLQPSDTTDPLGMGGLVTAPTSETLEAASLN